MSAGCGSTSASVMAMNPTDLSFLSMSITAAGFAELPQASVQQSGPTVAAAAGAAVPWTSFDIPPEPQPSATTSFVAPTQRVMSKHRFTRLDGIVVRRFMCPSRIIGIPIDGIWNSPAMSSFNAAAARAPRRLPQPQPRRPSVSRQMPAVVAGSPLERPTSTRQPQTRGMHQRPLRQRQGRQQSTMARSRRPSSRRWQAAAAGGAGWAR
jgi:hypothetical protein